MHYFNDSLFVSGKKNFHGRISIAGNITFSFVIVSYYNIFAFTLAFNEQLSSRLFKW